MTADELAETQRERFRQRPDLALRDDAEAVRFIATMGLVLLFRSRTIHLPNLADACMGGAWEWGDNPTGLSAWELKETIPASGQAFYAKLLGGRGTFVRWSLLPALQAAWQPERRARRLNAIEELALGVVTMEGPISTRELRREVQAMLPCEGREVRAALAGLQERLSITVAGGSLEGWSMHQWDLLERCTPESQRREVPADEARRQLVEAFVNATLAAKPGALGRLFGWPAETTRETLAELAGADVLLTDVPIDGLPGRFVVARSLLG